MWITQQQLKHNLSRWREAGWVTEEGARRIGEELAMAPRGVGFAGVLAVLGVVLLGFALMSFVAANWQDMGRLLRLTLIFVALLGSYATAGLLWRRGHSILAEAAVLAGVCVFGAGIMLISQMYHIDGHPPDAVLVWAVGALAAGVLTGSRSALGATAALLGLWTTWETVAFNTVHLPLLPAAAVFAVAIAIERWNAGLHLVAMLVVFWLIKMGYFQNGGANHILALIGLGICAAAVAVLRVTSQAPTADGELLRAAHKPAAVVLGYGMVAAFAGLFGLQFVSTIPTDNLVMFAALTLVGLVVAIAYGVLNGHRGAVWLGYVGFSVEILTLYFKTVGTLLGSSVFFLVAGLIVIALAGFAYRLHRISGPVAGEA